MFKFNPRKLLEKILNQLKDNLKYKTMQTLKLTLYLPINTSHNHTYNLYNKEKMLKLNGYKKKIKSLTTNLLLKLLSIKPDIDLKLLMFQVTFTTHKKSLNLLLIEKKFKLTFNKLLLNKLLQNQLLKVPNTLNLNMLKELLFLILFKKKFQLEFLNQLYMMFLFTNMNTFLLMNLVILVVVMIKDLPTVSLISLTPLKLKLTEMVKNILMEELPMKIEDQKENK